MANFSVGQQLTATQMNNLMLVLKRDSAISGSPPASPGPFMMIAGQQAVSCTSATGTLTFPGGGFPTGLLCIVFAANSNSSVTIGYNAGGAATVTVVVAVNGVGFTGTATLSYVAIGW